MKDWVWPNKTNSCQGSSVWCLNLCNVTLDFVRSLIVRALNQWRLGFNKDFVNLLWIYSKMAHLGRELLIGLPYILSVFCNNYKAIMGHCNLSCFGVRANLYKDCLAPLFGDLTCSVKYPASITRRARWYPCSCCMLWWHDRLHVLPSPIYPCVYITYMKLIV